MAQKQPGPMSDGAARRASYNHSVRVQTARYSGARDFCSKAELPKDHGKAVAAFGPSSMLRIGVVLELLPAGASGRGCTARTRASVQLRLQMSLPTCRFRWKMKLPPQNGMYILYRGHTAYHDSCPQLMRSLRGSKVTQVPWSYSGTLSKPHSVWLVWGTTGSPQTTQTIQTHHMFSGTTQHHLAHLRELPTSRSPAP